MFVCFDKLSTNGEINLNSVRIDTSASSVVNAHLASEALAKDGSKCANVMIRNQKIFGQQESGNGDEKRSDQHQSHY